MATATATKTAGKGIASRSQVSELKTFHWVGKDKRGMTMKGEVLGKNANLVKADLRKQGITASSVSIKGKPLFGASGSKVTPKEIAFFSRQLAIMMKAGVPLVQSFDIIASGQKNPKAKELLSSIKADVEGGSSLSEALSKHPVQFDELYQNLVRAGETAGVLETVLDTIATYKENIESIKGKIKKALFYPATVIAVAIIVSLVLLLKVVPVFQQTFKQFGADLPAFTQMIVNASEFVQSYWWLMLGASVGIGVFVLATYRRSAAMQHLVDRITLKLPVIGQIMHNSAIARFARTLAITFRAGVPLVEALEIVAGATGSIVYGEAVRRVKEDVAVGYQLNAAMKQVNLFPNMVIQMTAIGEEAGALDTMLLKVAEYHEEEVNNAVDALSSLMEPFIMVFIGTIVGGMVIGMYLPIFKIAATM